MQGQWIPEILLIITAAFVGGLTARTFKFPPILGYAVSGLIFGVIGRQYFQSIESTTQITGLIASFLLFTLGFEFSVDKLKTFNKKILLVGTVQIVLVILFLFPLLMLLGMSSDESLLLAVIFSFSSAAVGIKILEEQGTLNHFPGNHVYTFLLIQSVFVIPAVFLIPLLFNPSGEIPESLGEFIKSSSVPILICVGIFIFSRTLLSRFLNVLYRYPSQELTILLTIFLAVLTIGSLQYAGLPQGAAAFFAGILISKEGRNIASYSQIRPLRDVLLVIFFVLTGMILNPSLLFSNALYIGMLVIVVLLIKFIAIYFTLRNSGYLSVPATFISTHLSSVGEFSIVLGLVALIERAITLESFISLVSIYIISVIITPAAVKNAPSIGKYLSSMKVMGFVFGKDYDSYENISIQKFRDHVIMCGHGKSGKDVRNLLDAAQISYIVLDYNKSVISALTDQNKMALYGDPSDENLLNSAYIKDARAIVINVPEIRTQKKIIKSALSLNPSIKIICRSHNSEDTFDLVNWGVNAIVIPEFEANMRIARAVMEVYRIPEEELNIMMKRLRKEQFIL